MMFEIHPNFQTGHLEYRAPGSAWWVQLSGCVVWGLSFATLLTLVLTPVLLAAPKAASAALARYRPSRSARRPHSAPEVGNGAPHPAE